MNDFLSPILYVMEDESEAFWCFVYLMERFGPNFKHDQSGMKFQFFALSKVLSLSPLCVSVCVCVFHKHYTFRLCLSQEIESECLTLNNLVSNSN